ncbi:MAG: hypothetical protein ACTHK7_04920 [Aureliella sp.]
MNSSRWIDLVRKSGVVTTHALLPWTDRCGETIDARCVASLMMNAGLLTAWQADLLLRGKWKGFFVDRYCLLNHLGTDNVRGTKTFSALDRDSGARVILEIVPPSRARTKDGGLFYVVRKES